MLRLWPPVLLCRVVRLVAGMVRHHCTGSFRRRRGVPRRWIGRCWGGTAWTLVDVGGFGERCHFSGSKRAFVRRAVFRGIHASRRARRREPPWARVTEVRLVVKGLVALRAFGESYGRRNFGEFGRRVFP